MSELEEILKNASEAWGSRVHKGDDSSSSMAEEEKSNATPVGHGIPPIFDGASRDSLEWCARIGSKNVPALLDMIDANRRGNVVLIGPSGAGKSTLMAMASHEAAVRGSRWIRHDELELLSRWTWSKDGIPSSIEKLFDCPLLMIDDLEDKQNCPMIETVLAARYDRGKRTWFTTCVEVDGIYARWPHKGSRRILNNATVITIGGKNER